MTKNEAIGHMRNGVKITHTYFDKKEWMMIKGDNMVLEDGVVFPIDEYWKYRTQDYWNDGYSFFKQE